MDWEGALKREMRALIFRLQAPPECSIPKWGLRPAARACQTIQTDYLCNPFNPCQRKFSGTDVRDAADELEFGRLLNRRWEEALEKTENRFYVLFQPFPHPIKSLDCPLTGDVKQPSAYGNC